jgi:hypothetical protein
MKKEKRKDQECHTLHCSFTHKYIKKKSFISLPNERRRKIQAQLFTHKLTLFARREIQSFNIPPLTPAPQN